MATMVDCHCEWCRKPMRVRSADKKRGWGKFCSKACKASDQAKTSGYAGPTAPEFYEGGWDDHKDYWN